MEQCTNWHECKWMAYCLMQERCFRGHQHSGLCAAKDETVDPNSQRFSDRSVTLFLDSSPTDGRNRRVETLAHEAVY